MDKEKFTSLEHYFYDLPRELIASYPSENRSHSRFLAVDKDKKNMKIHPNFTAIKQYFTAGDVLVLNDTKVFPARLFCCRKTGASLEFLLLKEEDSGIWQAMGKNTSRLCNGEELLVKGSEYSIFFHGRDEYGYVYLKSKGNLEIKEMINQVGKMPLPPYMKRSVEKEDFERYQTVYANEEGSVASPTAGLHFTKSLLREIENLGVKIVKITLHVGLGTFLPVKEKDIRKHLMHTEHYYISSEVRKVIRNAKNKRAKIFSVGTTTMRCLESAFCSKELLLAGENKTNIFIFPPYNFKIVDCLITNFHLPCSSLFILVAAFTDIAFIKEVYSLAIKEKMRFFSYGDVMLIFRN